MGKTYGLCALLVLAGLLHAPTRAEAADKDLQLRFLMAVHHGKLDEVKAAVADGAEVNALIDGKYLALNYAVKDDHVDVVRYLLSIGADLGAVDGNGGLPLGNAALHGNREIVMLLLASGAPVNAQDAWGDTALHAAAAAGNRELGSLFLAKGAELEARNRDGRTPLFRATEQLALTWTEDGGAREPLMARFLIDKGAKIDARDEAGRTPLHAAAGNGVVAAARLLIENGADVTAQDGSGNSVARYAILSAGGKGLDFYLRHGMSATEKNAAGWDLLNTAAEGGHPVAIRALLAHGAPVDGPGPDGVTPLVRAAHFLKSAALLWLVEGGADVTKLGEERRAKLKAWRGEEGETLYHLAAQEGTPKAIPFLISLGIPMEAATHDSQTAFTRDGETALHRAARFNRGLVAHALIVAGANVGARNEDEFTPLILAAAQGSRSVILPLLAGGADPDARDKGGNTALHRTPLDLGDLLFALSDDDDLRKAIAIRRGIYQDLLKAGANPALENAAGETAKERWEGDEQKAIQAMLDAK